MITMQIGDLIVQEAPDGGVYVTLNGYTRYYPYVWSMSDILEDMAQYASEASDDDE